MKLKNLPKEEWIGLKEVDSRRNLCFIQGLKYFCNKELRKIALPLFSSLIITAIVFISNQQLRAAEWNFAVFGDTRSNATDDGSGVNATAITAIATDISTNRNVSFVLISGDLIYGNGSSTSVADQFTNFKNAAVNGGLQVAGESSSRVAYYPVRGNHDHNVIDTSGTAWKTAFSTLPQNDPTTDSGGSGNSEVGMTYSFTNGNSLFLGLDEYINKATYPNQVNQAWVTSQLNNSTATHVFAWGA